VNQEIPLNFPLRLIRSPVWRISFGLIFLFWDQATGQSLKLDFFELRLAKSKSTLIFSAQFREKLELSGDSVVFAQYKNYGFSMFDRFNNDRCLLNNKRLRKEDFASVGYIVFLDDEMNPVSRRFSEYNSRFKFRLKQEPQDSLTIVSLELDMGSLTGRQRRDLKRAEYLMLVINRFDSYGFISDQLFLSEAVPIPY